MTSIVNGFVCFSCCDEATARKGRDPANPSGDPVKQAQADLRRGRPVADAASPDVLTTNAVAFGKEQSTVAVSDRPSETARAPGPALFVDTLA